MPDAGDTPAAEPRELDAARAEAIRWLAIDAPAASSGSVIDLNGASYVR